MKLTSVNSESPLIETLAAVPPIAESVSSSIEGDIESAQMNGHHHQVLV